VRRLAAWPLAVLSAAAAVAGCGGGGGEPVKGPPPAAPVAIRLSSPVVREGGVLPREYTCDGAGGPPPLRWTGVPGRARSLALLVEDPDAPDGTFVHWTLWGLPASDGGLEAGRVPPGARQGANGFGDPGWGAPCPPKGDARHRYVFHLYALSRPLDTSAGAQAQAVRDAIGETAIAQGRLVVTVDR
jgi:Raf kinase inhibitor-like YbhB/YbcL family protein